MRLWSSYHETTEVDRNILDKSISKCDFDRLHRGHTQRQSCGFLLRKHSTACSDWLDIFSCTTLFCILTWWCPAQLRRSIYAHRCSAQRIELRIGECRWLAWKNHCRGCALMHSQLERWLRPADLWLRFFLFWMRLTFCIRLVLEKKCGKTLILIADNC